MAEMENNNKSDAALREEQILEFWRENKIFEKTLSTREGNKEFVFYEGPPTANAKPALHHLEARAFKDAIPRYKTMQGFHVRRKGGWDTHGLPVELQVEKKLGLNSKKAIEEYGVAKFNKECRENVWEHVGEWSDFTERIGYWIDRENPYVTYHNNYIESLWNTVKKIDEQKLLYKDYKVVPWCPRCGTALSSHELAQGYEEVKDLSVYVKFKVVGQENTYLLAWTTTPWTLPGNVALAVGEDIDYVKIKTRDNNQEDLFVILSKDIYEKAKDKNHVLYEFFGSVLDYGRNNSKDLGHVAEELKGKNLVGLKYEPLFPFLTDIISESEKPKLQNAFKVCSADFVNTTDGTGIVHTAVMYGQDDFVLGTEVGLPKHHLVNLEGKFISGTGFLEGRFVKEVNADGKPTLAVDIIDDLKKRNLFFKQENYKHSYPHCWRCKTALIYYARDSWYIRMSDPKIKVQMIEENKTIHWEPEYTRDGRFGEWLREIKDWAISRERYWGTPLPVWICDQCESRHVVGSLEDLKNKSKKSKNKYFIMRHGEAIDNAKHIFDPQGDPNNHLTKKGEEEVVASAQKIKNENIDMVIVSPFLRTQETAKIILHELNLPENALKTDERLHEFNEPNIELVEKRMGKFIFEMEKIHSNKKILIITHGNPIWVLHKIVGLEKSKNFLEKEMFKTAEVREIPIAKLPHNENYEVDLHRPYIDEIKLICDCGGEMTRTREVMDVWFDSGCMPFAQDHYPFENKKWVDGPGYPADYISEAIDQTRGWFYTLHAVGTLMGRGKAYKNVICLGHLLDAKGKKMSKSLGNIVDPWEMMNKYGVDTLRLWMYCVNQPGESKNFDEKTVVLLSQQVFGLLYNVLAFYELYQDSELEKSEYKKSENILDQWILARLNELIKFSTENLDSYKLLEPVRSIRDFIGDLSTWYLRRSRDRIKDGDVEAKKTLYFVLKTISKILAPFAPFTAEDIWLKLKNENDVESVHLEQWPKMSKSIFDIFGPKEDKILKDMQIVRDICTAVNSERQKANIPVRQVLYKIEIKNLSLDQKYLEIIKEEINIKEIKENKNLETEVLLDTEITPKLKQEGNYRELVRALQDMRKKMGLTPNESVSISFETGEAGKDLIQKFEADMKRTVLISKIDFAKNSGEEIKIDNLVFKVEIVKI